MKVLTISVGVMAAALAFNASAQTAPVQGPQHITGKVLALSDKQLTLTADDGSTTSLDLTPTVSVNVTEPITVEQIEAGSYVATANKTQADGSGVSIEIRVFPPSTPRFDVNRAMDATGETMMTNGVVAKVVGSANGRLLTVDYGTGSRQIMVPPNISITRITPGTLSLLHPGLKIHVTTFLAMAARPARLSIQIAKADLM